MEGSNSSSSGSTSSEIGNVLSQNAGALVGVALFSAVINVLGLTGSVYMLQIYDRVLVSYSVPTLAVLTVAMFGLYLIYGLLDLVRLRLLVRIGNRIDRALQRRVFCTAISLPIRAGQDGNRQQPIADLDQIRAFISGSGPSALFDLPWLPVYLLVIYLLHPLLGLLALFGALASVILTMLAELLARAPTRRASETMITRRIQADAARRNAEAVCAMGLGDRMSAMWSSTSERFLRDQRRVADVVGATGAASRTWRLILQLLMLGLGAFLVIGGEASAGVIIASSIMLTRALQPIDVAIANWRSFAGARQSYARLTRLLRAVPPRQTRLVLPRPRHRLSVEDLAIAAPGQQRPILHDVSFSLVAGNGLGIIGPSGSGKSTLVRALVGAWVPLRGRVRFDDASIDQWDEAALGRDIGYLPQDIELFDGTVAENIARFDPDAGPEVILAAAEAAGVKQLILRLPEGFQTRLGESGAVLSAGQRQLVGLARALYGDPFLVVLDEPNSNLDADGDAALTAAVRKVRDRGGIVVVVAHRSSAFANIDQLLFLANATVQAFGPRDEVLQRVTRSAQRPEPTEQRPQTVVPLPERRQDKP